MAALVGVAFRSFSETAHLEMIVDDELLSDEHSIISIPITLRMQALCLLFTDTVYLASLAAEANYPYHDETIVITGRAERVLKRLYTQHSNPIS